MSDIRNFYQYYGDNPISVQPGPPLLRRLRMDDSFVPFPRKGVFDDGTFIHPPYSQYDAIEIPPPHRFVGTIWREGEELVSYDEDLLNRENRGLKKRFFQIKDDDDDDDDDDDEKPVLKQVLFPPKQQIMQPVIRTAIDETQQQQQQQQQQQLIPPHPLNPGMPTKFESQRQQVEKKILDEDAKEEAEIYPTMVGEYPHITPTVEKLIADLRAKTLKLVPTLYKSAKKGHSSLPWLDSGANVNNYFGADGLVRFLHSSIIRILRGERPLDCLLDQDPDHITLFSIDIEKLGSSLKDCEMMSHKAGDFARNENWEEKINCFIKGAGILSWYGIETQRYITSDIYKGLVKSGQQSSFFSLFNQGFIHRRYYNEREQMIISPKEEKPYPFTYDNKIHLEANYRLIASRYWNKRQFDQGRELLMANRKGLLKPYKYLLAERNFMFVLVNMYNMDITGFGFKELSAEEEYLKLLRSRTTPDESDPHYEFSRPINWCLLYGGMSRIFDETSPFSRYYDE